MYKLPVGVANLYTLFTKGSLNLWRYKLQTYQHVGSQFLPNYSSSLTEIEIQKDLKIIPEMDILIGLDSVA